MRRKNRIAALLSCLVMTVSSYGGVIVTDENCDPTIPPDAYLVVHLGDNHFDVYLLDLYKPFDDNFFEIHPTSAGVIIDNIFIDVTGPPAGAPVIAAVNCSKWLWRYDNGCSR